MGNCYYQNTEYTEEQKQRHLIQSRKLSEKLKNQSNQKKENSYSTANNSEDKNQDLYAEFDTKPLSKELDDHINDFNKSNPKAILQTKLKTLSIPLESYFEITKTSNVNFESKHIHCFFNKLIIPFTPAVCVLFELNVSSQKKMEINANLDSFEIIDSSERENRYQISQIELIKTKKILISQSKSFLNLRIFTRLSNNDFVISGRSISRTELAKSENLIKLRKSLVNECEILLFGTKYEKSGEKWRVLEVSKGDFRTKTGKSILNTIYKKVFQKYYNKGFKELTEFVLKDHSKSDLKWFGNDQNEVKIILNEQRKILYDMMVQDPTKFENEWVDRLRELNQNIHDAEKNKQSIREYLVKVNNQIVSFTENLENKS